ncbi:MAG: DUF975 family protein [Bacteroidales bacterium]
MNEKIVLKQMLRESSNILKDNILILLGLIFLSLVISFAFSMIGSFFSAYLLKLGLSIIASCIQFYISLMIIKFTLKVIKGDDPGFYEIMPSFRQLGNYILSTICIMLPVLFCCLPLVGIIFFNDLYRNPVSLIPMILVCFLIVFLASVFIITTLPFIPYLIIDKNLGPIKAIKQSFELSKGYRGFLFLSYVLVSFGAVLGCLALVVGLFVVLAWSQAYYALLYTKIRDIKSLSGEEMVLGEDDAIDSQQAID